jgi:hypothetical protein
MLQDLLLLFKHLVVEAVEAMEHLGLVEEVFQITHLEQQVD